MSTEKTQKRYKRFGQDFDENSEINKKIVFIFFFLFGTLGRAWNVNNRLYTKSEDLW